MRRFIFIVLILVASVWVGMKLAIDPGLALFSWRNWSLEMPLWFAAICFFVVILVVYWFVRIFDGVDQTFYRFKNWLKWRRKNKAYSKTNRGLLELIEGNWRAAENSLLEGIDQSDAPLVNYLGAAKAAHERRVYEKRDVYLRRAYDSAPQAQLAIGITQARFQIEQKQWEQALATLKRLHALAPKQPVVLRLLEKVYVHVSDWDGMLKLIPALRKCKLITTEQSEKLELHVYEQWLNAMVAKSVDMQKLQDSWRMIPSRLQKKSQLVYSYVKQLSRYSDAADQVEKLIYTAVKREWHAGLVVLYGTLKTDNSTQQLAHAEKWLKVYDTQPLLFLTLGRLSERNQLFGKARDYYETAIRLGATPAMYFDYANLLQRLGQADLASGNYRAGLALGSGMQIK